jgi:hypothetical protein
LSDHPDVSGFENTGVAEDEGQHLQSVYPPAAAHGGPGRFGFRREAYLDDTSPLASPGSADQLLEEWQRYWDTEKRILIEKSPPNLIRTRFLQALFPGCRFVIALRHPIAVAYATQKWTSRVPQLWALRVPERWMPRVWIHSLIEHWVLCHEQFERDRPFLRRVHVFRYEDFVESPQEHVDALYAFLGLSPAPLSREVRKGVNDRYWETWVRRRTSPFTRVYANRVIRHFEDRVRRFGYSLLDESAALGGAPTRR